MIRGGFNILRGYGGTPTLSQGATLVARWLHEPHPNQQSAIRRWG